MQRHEITPMLAMRFGNGVGGLLACGAEFRFEFGDPGLELQHSLYAGEVHALGGEFLDAAEQSDVGVAVPTASATGARRFNEPLYKRYLIDNILFILYFLRQAFFHR